MVDLYGICKSCTARHGDVHILNFQMKYFANRNTFYFSTNEFVEIKEKKNKKGKTMNKYNEKLYTKLSIYKCHFCYHLTIISLGRRLHKKNDYIQCTLRSNQMNSVREMSIFFEKNKTDVIGRKSFLSIIILCMNIVHLVPFK